MRRPKAIYVALYNSWDRRDHSGAQVILHMMKIGNERFYNGPPMCGVNDIQELSKTFDLNRPQFAGGSKVSMAGADEKKYQSKPIFDRGARPRGLDGFGT